MPFSPIVDANVRHVTLGSAWAMFAFALCATACHPSPTSPSDAITPESLLVQGITRTYLLHVPATFPSGSGALVVALPGRTQTGLFFQGFTDLNAKADQEGFAVAYADGLFQPASGAVNWAYYRNDYVDDVSFLRELIATLQARLRVNPGRVFVTGFSSGGFMAYRAAVEMSDVVAAVGVVGGRLFREEGGAAANVPPARGPVSVVMLQGEFDTPYWCDALLSDRPASNRSTCWSSTSEYDGINSDNTHDDQTGRISRCGRRSARQPACLWAVE